MTASLFRRAKMRRTPTKDSTQIGLGGKTALAPWPRRCRVPNLHASAISLSQHSVEWTLSSLLAPLHSISSSCLVLPREFLQLHRFLTPQNANESNLEPSHGPATRLPQQQARVQSRRLL